MWLSLSVGRKHTAEARWLLPMLCRAGHITKNEIGAIRIHQHETHIELRAECVDKFLETVGPSRKVEKSITVTRLKGIPDTPDDSDDKPAAKRKPYDPTKPSAGAKRKYAGSDDADGGDQPRAKKPQGAKPWDKGAKKPYKTKGDKPFKAKGDKPFKAKGDKPFKAKGKPSGKPAGKPAGGKPGSSPLKRKKLSLKKD
mgnify:FL=1